MAKVELIKLHPMEVRSAMAFAIAYCIGADHDNAQEIADSITDEEMWDCIDFIRERMSR